MSSKRRIITVITSLVICFMVMSTATNAYAFNPDYLEQEKWSASKNASTVRLSNKSTTNYLSGAFSYFGEEDSFYTNFSITESSISQDYQDIRVDFYITNEKESYEFSVSENGMEDSMENERNLFQTYQSFVTAPEEKGGSYIVAITFEELNITQNIKIYLYVNGHRYLIAKDISFTPTEPQTTKAEKTTKQEKTTKSSKKSSATTTRKKSETTTKYSAKSSKSSATTKYNASYDATEETQYEYTGNGSEDYEAGDTEQASAESEDESSTSATSKMQPQSKALLIASGVVLLIGVAVLIYSLTAKNKKKNENQKEENEKVEKPESK